jgi:hypothetical protein
MRRLTPASLFASAIAAVSFVAGCASSGGSAGQSDGEAWSADADSFVQSLYLFVCGVAGYNGSGCPNDNSANSTTSGAAAVPTNSGTTPVLATSDGAVTQITPLLGATPDASPAQFSSWQDHGNGVAVTANGPGAVVATSRSGGGTSVSFTIAASLYPLRTATLTYASSGSLRQLHAYDLDYVARSDSPVLSGQPGIDVAWGTSSTGQTAFTSAPAAGVALVANPFELGWDYQSFGAWTDPEGPAVEHLHANSFGAATPGSSVPASGAATFTGKLAGMYVDPSGKGSMAAANLNVDVDFRGRTLSLASSGMKLSRDPSVTSAAPHLDVSGTLAYAPGSSAFTGTLVNAGGTMSGVTRGQFYGPAAQELGGMFVLHAPKTVESFAGAYGAKR